MSLKRSFSSQRRDERTEPRQSYPESNAGLEVCNIASIADKNLIELYSTSLKMRDTLHQTTSERKTERIHGRYWDLCVALPHAELAIMRSSERHAYAFTFERGVVIIIRLLSLITSHFYTMVCMSMLNGKR